MKNVICYLCKSRRIEQIADAVRDRADIRVLRCAGCGLIFLSSFAHISKNFYEDSRIHEKPLAMRSWIRITEKDDERRFQTLKPILYGKKVLDFGSGNCNFLFKVANLAGKVVGVEPERRVRRVCVTNLETHGIKVYRDLQDITSMKFDVITLFHVVEHLPNPRVVLNNLSNLLEDGGQIFIETPNADDALFTLYNSGAFSKATYWSCHLFLFNSKTLAALACQSNIVKINYIKQMQRYPVSNHLHWLAKGKPRGQILWHFLNSKELSLAYEKQLALIGKCDTLFGSFSKG